MTEHHPDMDLIMALAGGELPPEEAARLESQLQPEARAELDTQRAALAMLDELPRPAMSPDESRRLRSAVRRELSLDPGQVHTARSQRRPRHRFARALPALAAAASLVAVIAIAVNLTGGGLDENEAAATTAAAQAAPATAAPATTAAAYTAADVEEATTAAMEEEPMLEEAPAEADMLADAAVEEAEAFAEEEAVEHAPTTTSAVTTRAMDAIGVTDTTEPSAAGSEPDLAFAFSTDRPDDALLFTDAVIAEGGEPAVPMAELAGRATEEGLVCWEYVASAAGPDDSVSFFGYGLVDGEEGEAYRIEPGPARSQDGNDEEAAVILLFVYPDCRPVDFRAG